ncbi:FliM/FliN family flagellar motor switch protein [Romboutsia lituseburensis]|uniref:Flagellar motor switch protein FliN/FliY n=1 Tax=Romboutsia lituseburensis DSM 797 TaxID=1121325 RepID=A0A1G9P9W5_9FIRM|nr:FliM/FliN family flagellar motor switch protein [Romboutsia lituseburensis]CEH33282.1 Surface presentation of antigens (SPOA) [Romboutsia lituseburensis]SDL94987.1 flagellar motor switch protein FliN/FliY [Romboutsia lituseburensis DSM 797]
MNDNNIITTDSVIYEAQFEQLVEGEKVPLNALNDIMEAQMDIEVLMGETKEKIGKIVNYKVGDIIKLDKHLEETLDISVNGKVIASGESIIIDNRLGIRLSKIKKEEDGM